MKEKLKVRQQVLLNILAGPYQGNYYSTIENLVGDDIVVVTMPPAEDGSVLVNAGEKLSLFYWDSLAQYAFEARVIDQKQGSRPTLTLKKCSEEQRMQRRSFFRVQARLRVLFEKEGEERNEPPYEGQTLNISGGGMLLATAVELEVGDNLPLLLYLSDRQSIKATGRVERIEYMGAKNIYRAGVVFTTIYENDRDKIIAYVFTKEIELRKKGLL